ncbi:hypothetical protein BHE74_00040914 [Ensete ventricosum]|nr:hypothetical protein GW17_00013965 [Ensete ventricosum]RWW52646.1 hypothetical protein BHE74_00040914 [Ensete ventricosum]
MHFLIQVAYGFDSGDQSRQSVICEPSVTVPSHQDPYSPGFVDDYCGFLLCRQPRRPGGGTHPDLEHFQGPDYI